MPPAVDVKGLVKTYDKGKVKALAGLDLQVDSGEVLALLGPNGAGKTTAVSIMATLLDPDSGGGTIAGFDVVKQPSEVRKHIGLSGQFAAVDEALTGYENLFMFSRLYRMNKAQAKVRATELLEEFDLTDAADRVVKTYSGGMRRRLDVAGALVARPPVIFLDEPTTGLDPTSRIELWKTIRGLVADGAALVLTTQYLEEADELSDNIVVIDKGQAIARGTADELKAQVGGDRIEVTLKRADQLQEARDCLGEFAVSEIQVDEATARLKVPIEGGTPVLTRALNKLEAAGIELVDAGQRRPTLDDVFLALTGHEAEESTAEEKIK